MRVLNSITDPRIGGPQQRALNVAKKLQDRGIETIFLIPEGDGDFGDLAYNTGYKVLRTSPHQIRPPKDVLGNLRFLAAFGPMVQQIQRIIDYEDIDVVHAAKPINYQTAVAANQSDVPLVWHFNDTSMPSPVKQLSAMAARRWADEIVVVADAVRDYYFSSQHSSRTIYTPVNLEKFDPDLVTVDKKDLCDDLGIASDVLVVGTIGNINPLKGHEYLLHAIHHLENDIQVAVPIVGKKLTTQKSYYKRLLALRSELGLENSVEFVGYRSDIPELLSLFDIFILPSVAEACPTVVLEAMAMETPVVATNVGGVPEEIPDEDHGWVVPPKDPQALGEAISEALTDPEKRYRKVKNARSRVESVFSLDICADNHEDLYRSLMNR